MMKSWDSLLMIVTKYENEKSQNIFEFFKAYCKWKFKKSLLLHVFLPLFGNFSIKGREWPPLYSENLSLRSNDKISDMLW